MKKNRNTFGQSRGQIQLGETVAVVIIVVVLLVIGIAFWNKVSNSNVKDIKTQTQELSVIELANNIPELQELKCSELKYKDVKCLDLYKLRAMSAVVHNSDPDADRSAFNLYNNYFTNSRITVNIMYPEYFGEKNITIYDSQLNNKSNTTRTLLIPIPVNIKDTINDRTYYGVMSVEGYYS